MFSLENHGSLFYNEVKKYGFCMTITQKMANIVERRAVGGKSKCFYGIMELYRQCFSLVAKIFSSDWIDCFWYHKMHTERKKKLFQWKKEMCYCIDAFDSNWCCFLVF